MDKQSKFRVNAAALYDLPLRFWKRLLDADLHFHLGHFPAAGISLPDSMRQAVYDLAGRVPGGGTDVLDVGCGWGGPAFELARMWRSRVLGLTVSRRQTRWVNFRARRCGLPVRALQANAEDADLRTCGTFDVLWLYESIEHVQNRRDLLRKLHACARPNGILAAAVSCRAPEVPRVLTYSDIMGTAPLDTPGELEKSLLETGWTVLVSSDCTALTLPIWDLWIQNLESAAPFATTEFVSQLRNEFLRLKRLYQSGSFRSIQIVAETT
jgi:cyclopropane fatty-acyl-phospholipid synthase-like methyltransferase